VGKTELARRLASLAQAPFVKVEASTFTEVGYIGRDVESMIRDLVDVAVELVREQHVDAVEDDAWKRVDARLLDLLAPPPATAAERAKTAKALTKGTLDDRRVEIEISVRTAPPPETGGTPPFGDVESTLGAWLADALPPRLQKRNVTVETARDLLFDEEVDTLLDHDRIIDEALDRAENTGIVFIDEIDKIVAAPGGVMTGPDVSRAGVQRDLLPVIEGTNVQTRYGLVRTDHVLFLAAGAFHHAKPSDLIPELQGRFPIRVELAALGEEDFVRILTEPENALTIQYRALLGADGVKLEFEPAAIREIAARAALLNATSENIGARRLQSVLVRLLEDVLFDAPDAGTKRFVVTRDVVKARLDDLLADSDTARFIL